MSASPRIDQLAAQVRDRHAKARAARGGLAAAKNADSIADKLATQLHDQVDGIVTDEQLGAVLLAAAGILGGLAQDFAGHPQAITNVTALAGERLYHGRGTAFRKPQSTPTEE